MPSEASNALTPRSGMKRPATPIFRDFASSVSRSNVAAGGVVHAERPPRSGSLRAGGGRHEALFGEVFHDFVVQSIWARSGVESLHGDSLCIAKLNPGKQIISRGREFVRGCRGRPQMLPRPDTVSTDNVCGRPSPVGFSPAMNSAFSNVRKWVIRFPSDMSSWDFKSWNAHGSAREASSVMIDSRPFS